MVKLKGEDKTVFFDSFKKIEQAKLTNLIEEEIEDLKPDNKSIRLNLGHHSIETIKIK